MLKYLEKKKAPIIEGISFTLTLEPKATNMHLKSNISNSIVLSQTIDYESPDDVDYLYSNKTKSKELSCNIQLIL